MSGISTGFIAALTAAALTAAALAPGLFMATLIALSPEAELDEEVAKDVSEDIMLNYRNRSKNDHN